MDESQQSPNFQFSIRAAFSVITAFSIAFAVLRFCDLPDWMTAAFVVWVGLWIAFAWLVLVTGSTRIRHFFAGNELRRTQMDWMDSDDRANRTRSS